MKKRAISNYAEMISIIWTMQANQDIMLPDGWKAHGMRDLLLQLELVLIWRQGDTAVFKIVSDQTHSH